MIRTALRKLLDREVGVLGGELDTLTEQHRDLQIKLLAFEERFERIRARIGMRVTRAERLAPRDEFEQLLQRRQGRERDEEFADDFPDFRSFR